MFTYNGVPAPTPKASARLVVTEDVPTTDLALKGMVVNTTTAGGATNTGGTGTGTGTANGTKKSGTDDVLRGSMYRAIVAGLVMAMGTWFL